MLLMCEICDAENSGGGLPQSKTLARGAMTPEYAKRLGLRQPSGAFRSGEGKTFDVIESLIN